jgi:thiamine biosynthesis protein ThiI
MKNVIIVHHHEIVLKGDNRGFFERQLTKNIRHVLKDIAPRIPVLGGYGKFILPIEENDDTDAIIRRLKYVFGIANICTGVEIEQNVDLFCRAAESLLAGEVFSSLKVETRRADKNFSVGSMEVNRIVGAALCSKFGVRADMEHPDRTVYVEITDNTAYVYASKVQGAKGLPVGVSGRVVSLLSAGIDSPVAAWQLMKRGANVIFVHFHSMPYTTRESVDQTRDLARILTKYQFRSKLYLVPLADAQQEIVQHAPQALRVILYRRMMVRIACDIAREEKAEALVTGESVGQVASQTLRNIRAIDEIASLPILRPLAGADKDETISVARTIGTFEISQQPYDDCCSFLAPRKPETWAALGEIHSAEETFSVDRLAGAAREKTEVEIMHFPQAEKEQAVAQDVA